MQTHSVMQKNDVHMGEHSPLLCVERYLFHQASHDWDAALMHLSDEFLASKYEVFKQHCTPEAARRYGYSSVEEARNSPCRDFVLRMLQSSTCDADGRNPSHNSVPFDSDCHIHCRGEEVVVTLSTPLACTRTRYLTQYHEDEGRRLIIASRCEPVLHTEKIPHE